MDVAKELKAIENEINSLERRLTKLRQAGTSTHKILSTTHNDSVAANVSRGDVIIGNSTPRWSRLAIGNNNDVLTVIGSDVQWQPAPGGGGGLTVLDRDDTQPSVSNASTYQTLYSYSVPAGELSTNRIIQFWILGYFFNTSGTSRFMKIRISYGGVTMYEDTMGSIGSISGQQINTRFLMHLMNQGVTYSQHFTIRANLGSSTNPVTGYGRINTDESSGNVGGHGVDPGVDSTGAQTFLVEMDPQFASVNWGFQAYMIWAVKI